MGGTSTPLLDDIVHCLAADLLDALELALREVPGRVGTGLVDHICEDIGPIGGQALAGNRVLSQGISKHARCLFKGIPVLIFYARGIGVVHHHGLKALRAHHGPHAPTASMP